MNDFESLKKEIKALILKWRTGAYNMPITCNQDVTQVMTINDCADDLNRLLESFDEKWNSLGKKGEQGK